MANEKRLISLSDAVEATFRNIWWTESQQADVRRFLREQPVVDAVEVVRCKDCKHYVDGPYDNGDMMCDCWGEWIFPNDDDFCSYGERKDNDT